MLMATVNTVLGPVDASQIGGTMSHVHLTINILCWFREPDSGVQRGISEQKISLENLGFVRRNAMLVKGNRSHSKLESALQLRYEKRHYEERAASAQGIVGPDSAPGPSRDVGSGGRIRAPHSGLGGGGRRAERTAQPECVQLLEPPSADRPAVKRQPPRAPSGRPRGAQPGHPLYQRPLVPVEQAKAVVACRPSHCRRCGRPLPGKDPQPWRHQVLEVPPTTPEVTEYQLHRVRCAACGIATCGTLPPGVPMSGYGPRLASLVALCSGAYRLS